MRRLESALALLCLLLGAWAPAAEARGEQERARESARRAAVRIMAGEFDAGRVFRSRSSASGVIISADGYVLTARHAVFSGGGPADLYPEVWAGLADPRHGQPLRNRAVRLRFVAADPATDLALFQLQPAAPRKAPARYPFLRLADEPDVAYGDTLRVIGYGGEQAPQSSEVAVGVVELDEIADWIKVEGDPLRGVAGGAVVNARYELVGLTIRVGPQSVTLFNEENVPVGRIELERVGMLRPAGAISRFLGGALRGRFAQAAVKSFSLGALVLDERTRRPVAGATIGVLTPAAASPEFYVTPDELLSHGRSDAFGECVLSRRLPAGRYLVKVVHPDYETEIAEVNLASNTERLVVKLRRGAR